MPAKDRGNWFNSPAAAAELGVELDDEDEAVETPPGGDGEPEAE